MKIRFLKHEDTFTLEVKRWHGWEAIYLYGGVFSIKYHFNTKEEGINYLIKTMKSNPIHVKLIEYPTIIVHYLEIT